MKNFPEQDQFNELEKRLQGYSEEPDELVWQNIDKALRPGKRIIWFPWIDRLSTVVAIGLFGLLVNFNSGKELHSSTAKDVRRDVASATPPDEPTDTRRDQTKRETDPILGNKEASAPKNVLENVRSAEVSKENDELSHEKLRSTKFAQKSSTKGLIISRDDENKLNQAETLVGPALSNSSTGNTEEDQKIVLESIDSFDSVMVVQQAKQDSVSQPENSPKESKRKISKRGLTFYATLTPQLSFQRVVPVSNDGVVISEVYSGSIFSSDRFGFAIDAGLQGHITKRLEYYGGLSLHQQKQSLRYSYQSEGKTTLEQDDDGSYVITPETTTAIIQYRMLNLGANLGLLYNLQGKKLAHKIGAGLSYQQGLSKSSSERYNNSESSYLFYQIFYRNEVRVRPRLRVYVQPTFSHSLYANEKLDAPFTLKPYRAGIGFGVLYDF
jgi:hypothetical protein